MNHCSCNVTGRRRRTRPLRRRRCRCRPGRVLGARSPSVPGAGGRARRRGRRRCPVVAGAVVAGASVPARRRRRRRRTPRRRAASASTPALDHPQSLPHVVPPPGLPPLWCVVMLSKADGDQVERQPQQAGAEHVGPGGGGVGGHVRRDAAAQAVLRAAEVLGDEGRDHGGRRGDRQRRGTGTARRWGCAPWRSTCVGVAAYERSSSRCVASTWRRPLATLTRTMK